MQFILFYSCNLAGNCYGLYNYKQWYTFTEGLKTCGLCDYVNDAIFFMQLRLNFTVYLLNIL